MAWDKNGLSNLTRTGHPRCKEKVYRRETYRYTGRGGGSGFQMHYTQGRCSRRARYGDFCKSHAPYHGFDVDKIDGEAKALGERTVYPPTPTYRAWINMRRRCQDPKDKSYQRYSSRGITVCARWQEFENFLADMGERPDGMTLERKDNDKGYSPDNCIWATKKAQVRNRECTQYLVINGVKRPTAAWCEIYGIKRKIVQNRLANGWDDHRALTFPVHKRRRPAVQDVVGE